jgi:hypothetical protein
VGYVALAVGYHKGDLKERVEPPMTNEDAIKNEAAVRRLHETYVSKVNEADECGNDQLTNELANDYLNQLRSIPLR